MADPNSPENLPKDFRSKFSGFFYRLRRPHLCAGADHSSMESSIRKHIPPELAIDPTISSVDDVLDEFYIKCRSAVSVASTADMSDLSRILHAKINDDMKHIEEGLGLISSLQKSGDLSAAANLRDMILRLILPKTVEFRHALNAFDTQTLDTKSPESEVMLASIIENFSSIIRADQELAEAIEKGYTYSRYPARNTTDDPRVKSPRYSADGYRERTNIVLIPLGRLLLEKFPALRKFKTTELMVAHENLAKQVGIQSPPRREGEGKERDEQERSFIYNLFSLASSGRLQEHFDSMAETVRLDDKAVPLETKIIQEGDYVTEIETIRYKTPQGIMVVASRARRYEGNQKNYKSDQSRLIVEEYKYSIAKGDKEMSVSFYREKNLHIDVWTDWRVMASDGNFHFDVGTDRQLTLSVQKFLSSPEIVQLPAQTQEKE